MMKIYIVCGTTGEYSSRNDWNVLAFCNKEKADILVKKAQARAKEIEKSKSSRYSTSNEKNEFDPDMLMDYTGTEYYISEVELAEEE